MRIIGEALRHGARLELGGVDALRQRCGDNLLAIVGGGRGATLATAGDGGGIWLPLRGKLRLASGDSGFTIEPGQLLISEPDQRLQATGRGASLWIVLLAQRNVWRRALIRAGGGLAPEPSLVPAWHTAAPTLRRLALRLVRATLEKAGEYALQSTADDLLGSVVDLQSGFSAMIERCPGRTLAQRQNVFLRLQRGAQSHGKPAVSRNSTFPSWRVSRAIRPGISSARSTRSTARTPHAYLVDRRLERGTPARALFRRWRSARSPAPAVSRTAVPSRACFKQRFGISAAALRREHGVGVRTTRKRRCDSSDLLRCAVSATPSANSRQLGAATDF